MTTHFLKCIVLCACCLLPMGSWAAESVTPILAFPPLEGHQAGVTSVAFSPDGETFVSASRDGALILWDAATGAEIRTFRAYPDNLSLYFHQVIFSLDGKTIISISNSTIRHWDVQSGQQIQTVESGFLLLEDSPFAFSPDRQTLLTKQVLDMNTVNLTLWDLQTGQVRMEFDFPGQQTFISVRVGAVTFSADGQRIFAAATHPATATRGDHDILIWDTQTGERQKILSGSQDMIGSIALSADGKTVLGSLSGNHPTYISRLRRWDIETGDFQTFETELHDPVNLLALPNSSQRTVFWGHSIGIWENQTAHDFKMFRTKLTSVDLSPDGQRAVSGGHDGTLRLWDLQTGEELSSSGSDLVDRAIRDIVLSADGQRLLTAHQYGAIRLWNTTTGMLQGSFAAHDAWISTVALSADGNFLFSNGYEESESVPITSKLWDLSTLQEIHRFGDYGRQITKATFSSDGQSVWTASVPFSGIEPFDTDSTLRQWNTQTGELLREISVPATQSRCGVSAFSLAKDENSLFVGECKDYKESVVRQRDAMTGDVLRQFSPHAGTVQSITALENNRLLVGSDGFIAGAILVYSVTEHTLRLWDIDAETVVSDFNLDNDPYNGGVQSVSVTPDQQSMLVFGQKNTITLRRVDNGSVTRYFRSLSPWKQWALLSPDNRYVYSHSNGTILKWHSGLVETSDDDVAAKILMAVEAVQSESINNLQVTMTTQGHSMVDRYVVFLLPDDLGFVAYQKGTGFYPLNTPLSYDSQVILTKQQTDIVLEQSLPNDALSGEYQVCGVLTIPNSNLINSEDWMDWHCVPFTVQ